jgi:hypothetical protein
MNNNLLNPICGVAFMGVVAVWATTTFQSDWFKFILLGFALICGIVSLWAEFKYQKMNNIIKTGERG